MATETKVSAVVIKRCQLFCHTAKPTSDLLCCAFTYGIGPKLWEDKLGFLTFVGVCLNYWINEWGTERCTQHCRWHRGRRRQYAFSFSVPARKSLSPLDTGMLKHLICFFWAPREKRRSMQHKLMSNNHLHGCFGYTWYASPWKKDFVKLVSWYREQ